MTTTTRVEHAHRRYREAFGVSPPRYYGLDDDGHAELYERALARGGPLGDDDGPQVPDDALA